MSNDQLADRISDVVSAHILYDGSPIFMYLVEDLVELFNELLEESKNE